MASSLPIEDHVANAHAAVDKMQEAVGVHAAKAHAAIDKVHHAKSPDHFIQGAIKHPGALTEKAHAAGESPMAFARSHASAPGKTGQQARFAEFLAKVRPVAKKRGYTA